MTADPMFDALILCAALIAPMAIATAVIGLAEAISGKRFFGDSS